MTLKEKVQQVNPKRVSKKYVGGVFACPYDYAYLNCDREKIEHRCVITRCEECWNQEYVESKPRTLKEWWKFYMDKFMKVI